MSAAAKDAMRMCGSTLIDSHALSKFNVDMPTSCEIRADLCRGLSYRGSYALVGIKDGPALAEQARDPRVPGLPRDYSTYR